MEPSSLGGTPWMPTPEALVPIQRVPSGFSVPGGMGCASLAQSELGGSHVGSFVMVTMEYVPVGVG